MAGAGAIGGTASLLYLGVLVPRATGGCLVRRFQNLLADQAADGLAAHNASNGTQRATNQYADGTTGRDTNGGASGCAGHYAAAYQHRLGLALSLPRLQWELCCGGRILRRNAVSGSGLLGEVFVRRCDVSWPVAG